MDSFIKEIAIKGGEIVGKKFGKIGVKYTKKDAKDVVTEADILANKFITNAIKKKYPSHSIISEEADKEIKNSDYCWIIDPVDGTLNFTTNVPLFGTMIGLAYKGEMILSAIYFPCSKELLFAKRGKGVYLNGKRAYCSKQKKWEESYGVISVLLRRSAPIIFNLSKRNIQKMWVGAFGSSAVDALYVATGRRDWQFIQQTEIWDRVIPAFIMEESGCKVTTPEGKKWTLEDEDIVVANKYLHKTLLKVIKTKQNN